ncbi:MAG: hypothetical protein SYC29_15400 [Planctomycetota bacterium]|nr:hypothetical protein [Planctomycetota bacterium]
MRDVIRELERLRRRTGLMIRLQSLSVLASWIVGAGVGLVLIDYLLRMPGEFRLVLLMASVAALGFGVWRLLIDGLQYRPTLTQLALRVERSAPALRGRLASCVEFTLAGIDARNPLAARSVRETRRRLAGESMRAIIRPGRTLRCVGALLMLGAVAVALAAAYPAGARTGLARLLLPYGPARWPARTAVVSLMHEVIEHDGVHPRGRALPLRARNLTVGAEDGRVDAHYRLSRDGDFALWQCIVLTHQGEGVHERLVETDAEAIEYYFATEDARTERHRVRLIVPPAVNRAEVVVDPPPYAADELTRRVMDLGPGIDDRAVMEDAGLAGSHVDLLLELNKPLAAPDADEGRASWMRRTFGWNDDPVPRFEVDSGDPARWRLSWRLDATRDLALSLEDEHGFTNEDPIHYRIRAVADEPPGAVMLEPKRDMTVLPTARIDVIGEGRDDVALRRLALNAHVQRRDTEDLAPLSFAPARETREAEARLEEEIDLAGFDLAEGETVLLTAVAEDVFEVDGTRHDPVVSEARRLRIISAGEFAAQLRRELGAVREDAVRIEARQAELQDEIVDRGLQAGLRRAQARLGGRVLRQREVIEALNGRMRRNRYENESMSALLAQSRDLLNYAGRAANRALHAIETAAESAPADERAIIEAQQEVRDELADLIRLLDRDEDVWIVERELEELVRDQAGARGATIELSPQTIGRSRAELSQAEVRTLDRIAERQREMRDRARRLIDEMRRRAEALDEIDASSASALRAAAETGERREVGRDMERAAEQAEANRLQNAADAQQAALATLQRMAESLHQARKAKAEQLLRELADLVESITQLIAGQENELIALARAEQSDEFGGRDRAMIRLARNTRAVALDARAAGSDAQALGRALDRAAGAQDAAVEALRARPVDFRQARQAEERSLDLLKEAKQLAEALQEKAREAQTARRREALIEAYRALSEKQIAARQDTLPLVEVDRLGRRELVETRRLSLVQSEIRSGLADLEQNTREIVESEIFQYVHRLMDEWCAQVIEALQERDIGVSATDRQAMIAESIIRQIEALQPDEADEFARESSPGGGGRGAGSGAPPLIPPVAEIRRLRSLQEQIYNQTRDLDRRTDLDEARRRQRLLETGRMQRRLVELGTEMLEKLPQPQVEEETEPRAR